jgi:threonine/homoserine efflux transporter RhtA
MTLTASQKKWLQHSGNAVAAGAVTAAISFFTTHSSLSLTAIKALCSAVAIGAISGLLGYILRNIQHPDPTP